MVNRIDGQRSEGIAREVLSNAEQTQSLGTHQLKISGYNNTDLEAFAGPFKAKREVNPQFRNSTTKGANKFANSKHRFATYTPPTRLTK